MRSQDSGWGRVLSATMIVTFVGCATPDRSATPRTDEDTTPISPMPSPSTFESERHSYTVEVPPEWDVTEYPGTWTRLSQFNPGAEVAGEDVVLSPDGGAFLVANSMAIPAGMTTSDWRTAFGARVEAGLDPNCPERSDSGTLAGETATIVTQRCEGMVIVGRSLTHAGRGYYFTVGFRAGDPATKATLDGIVASIRFV
jgi:hypothetical protein